MTKAKFLLVQGRALKQVEESIQYFPDNWKDEFPIMKELGFYGIEWIYDKKSELSNPILSELKREDMISTSIKYNIKLENIVFDWFLHHSLFINDEYLVRQKVEKFFSLINLSIKSGFKTIILPILEKNNMITSDKRNQFIEIINTSSILDQNDIEIHLETNLPPDEELVLLEKLNQKKIKICFDVGNSASYGYDPNKVIKILGNRIGSVHIKDRKYNGPSVPLGTGNVNFQDVFKNLKLINFDGNYSFQIFRDKNTDNIKLLKDSVIFINNMINCDYNG